MVGALSDFTRALKIAPDNRDLLHKRGILWYATKNYENAVLDYNKILEINPNDIKALVTRGDIFLLLNKNEYACADFKRAESLGDGGAMSKRIFNCK